MSQNCTNVTILESKYQKFIYMTFVVYLSLIKEFNIPVFSLLHGFLLNDFLLNGSTSLQSNIHMGLIFLHVFFNTRTKFLKIRRKGHGDFNIQETQERQDSVLHDDEIFQVLDRNNNDDENEAGRDSSRFRRDNRFRKSFSKP